MKCGRKFKNLLFVVSHTLSSNDYIVIQKVSEILDIRSTYMYENLSHENGKDENECENGKEWSVYVKMA